MPTLEINGKRVQVDDSFLKLTPDQQNAAVDEIAKSIGGVEQQSISTTEDAGRSALSGLRRGVEDTIGTFGNANNRQGDLAQWAAEKLGASQDTGAMVNSVARRLSIFPTAPSTEDVTTLTTPVVGQEYQPKTTAGEYAKAVGEFVPAALAGKGGMVKRLVTQAAIPAVVSETAGQVTKGTKYEPYARFAGALAGGVMPTALKSVVSPMTIDAERRAAAQVLKGEGVDVTAGQISGNKKLKALESQLGGQKAQNLAEKQGEQFTAAVLKRAGIQANRATPEVMDEAFSRIGQKFDDLAANTAIKSDMKLVTDVSSVEKDYTRTVSKSNLIPYVGEVATDIKNEAAKGTIDGEWYKKMSSDLAAKARKTTDGEFKAALLDLRAALDDAMERSMAKANPKAMAEWRQARKEYRNILVLEDAAKSSDSGIISPKRLRQVVTSKDKRGYVRGKNEFSDVTRAGAFLMEALPDSGTATRTWAQNAAMNAPAVLGGIAGSPLGILGGIGGLMAGAAVPKGIGAALMSDVGQRYLMNNAANGINLLDPRINAALSGALTLPSANNGR